MRTKPKHPLYLGGFLCLLLQGQQARTQQIIEGIAAHVGDDVVLLSDVQKRLVRLAQLPNASKMTKAGKEEMALSSLIDDKLVAQEVRRLKIDVSETEIDDVVSRMSTQNKMDPVQFKEALRMQGMTMDQYREQIRNQLIKMRLVQSKVKNDVQIPEEDVRALYWERARAVDGTFKLRTSHILFKLAPGASAEEEAQAHEKIEIVRKELKAGSSFADLAQKYSEGPSASRGGDLGVFGRGQMVASFENAAYTATIGEMTGPVRTPFGLHLIWVVEKVPVEKGVYEKMAAQLRQELTNREIERLFRNYIKGLRSKTWISHRAKTSK